MPNVWFPCVFYFVAGRRIGRESLLGIPWRTVGLSGFISRFEELLWRRFQWNPVGFFDVTGKKVQRRQKQRPSSLQKKKKVKKKMKIVLDGCCCWLQWGVNICVIFIFWPTLPYLPWRFVGGTVVGWFGRRTRKPVIPGSSHALIISLTFFPGSTSRLCLDFANWSLSCQLVELLRCWISC